MRSFLSISVFLWVFLAVGLSASHASSNRWYDRYRALEGEIGDRWVDTLQKSTLRKDRDSSDLGWGESYVLHSYCALYWQTGNRAWLTKMQRHIDAVVRAADDDDGDGYLGWSSMIYSPMPLANSDFERTAPTGAVPGWNVSPTTEGAARVAPSDRVRAGAALEVSPSGGTVEVYQIVSRYDAHEPYVLRFFAKTGQRARVSVRDEATGRVIAETDVTGDAWHYAELPFRSPDQVSPLRVSLEVTRAAGPPAWFDDAVLSLRSPYLVHHGLMGAAMAEYIVAVEQLVRDRVLAGDDPLVAAAGRYRKFLLEQIIPQWEDARSMVGNTWKEHGDGAGSYCQPARFRSMATDVVFTSLPYNQANVFYEMLERLQHSAGAPDYSKRVKEGSEYFFRALQPRGPGYVWNYAYYSHDVEDASHANLDISLALVLFANDVVFDGPAMKRLTATLTETMWNHDEKHPVVAERVDGKGGDGFSRSLFSWTDLSQFDPRVWQIAAEQFRDYAPHARSELLSVARILRWDPSRVVNRGFELVSAEDRTLPARWERDGPASTPAQAALDHSAARRGQFGLALRPADQGVVRVCQPWTDWEAPADYRLEAWARITGPGVTGRVRVEDVADGRTVASVDLVSTDWSRATVSFHLPAAAKNHRYRICLEASRTGKGAGEVHVDGVRITWSGDPAGAEDRWDDVAGY